MDATGHAPLLPEFAELQVLEGFEEDGAPKLRPAKGHITLRHLLTHTSGIDGTLWDGFGAGDAAIAR